MAILLYVPTLRFEPASVAVIPVSPVVAVGAGMGVATPVVQSAPHLLAANHVWISRLPVGQVRDVARQCSFLGGGDVYVSS